MINGRHHHHIQTLSTASFPPQPPQTTTQKVALFIKNNWGKVMAYIVTLGLIVTIMGAMYGFKEIAKPFSIGVAIGVGFGILVSVITCIFLKQRSRSGWQLFRNGVVRRLDQGMSTLFFSIVATVILQTIPHFPYIGAFIGMLLMNHLCIQLYTGSANDPALPQIAKQLNAVEHRLRKLERGERMRWNENQRLMPAPPPTSQGVAI